MIWGGFPLFLEGHPYLNISLNGIQTSLPKEDGLSRLIVSIFISKFVNIKVTTLGRHRLGTNTSGLWLVMAAIDSPRNQAKEALRNHHSEEPLIRNPAYTIEVCMEVIPIHPENSILPFCDLQSFGHFRICRPFFTVISPGPIPFTTTPGISATNELKVLDLYCTKNRVYVRSYKT